ncbi:MAG: hypothetical protein JNL87_01140 [Burkholderiaceae bacterium]|nr:hypothetical protein [Burkholderiaceae bacterium]
MTARREGNKAAVERYRLKNTRIDYVPAPDVLAIIRHWRKARLNNCAAGVIDKLVREGHRAIQEAKRHDVRT